LEAVKLTSRFEDALVFAAQLHAGQKRKSTEIPYVAHLLAVTALVLEDGGDEDEAIAALLHDAVEDQGGLPTLEAIRERFGSRVARIVEDCTDSYQTPKPPWIERKRAYIEHLPSAQPDSIRVSLADKLHNTRSILRNLKEQGDSAWDKFKGGRDGSLWYYRTLAEIFKQVSSSPMVDELDQVVSQIEALTAANRPK